MIRTLEDFTGRYTIRYGAESEHFQIQIEKGYYLSIGTGQYGDPESDGIRVGVAIVNPDKRKRVLPEEGHPPALAYLVDGTLNGSTYWSLPDTQDLLLLSYQISLLTTSLTNGGLFKAPTIMITVGDPETAGVWGADDSGG